MPPFIQALMIFVPFLIVVAACSLYFSGYPERQARVRHWLAGTAPHMSSTAPDPPSRSVSAGRGWHRVSEQVFVSAEPNTDDTEPVSGATGASLVDTSARDIIRASLIAELLDSGLLTNRDKAICQVFRCSKASSSRPDAPFQIALRLVEQHRTKHGPDYRPLTPEHRADLQLDQR
jgi:hypothetical protein